MVVSNSRVSQWAATSLYAMNARARLPSGLRYLARFSWTFGGNRGMGAGDGRGECFAAFFGEPKKLNLDFVGGGVTSLGGGTGCLIGWELAFIWAAMCGSRLTLRLRVNSSLLCSILVHPVSLVISPQRIARTARTLARSWHREQARTLAWLHSEYHC